MKIWTIRFETGLNASIIYTVMARSYKEAIRKIKKKFPSVFNFD